MASPNMNGVNAHPQNKAQLILKTAVVIVGVCGLLAMQFAIDSEDPGFLRKGFFPENFEKNPYDFQTEYFTEKLKANNFRERASAAESLGHLRAYLSAPALAVSLNDGKSEVRREAAMSLGWIGSRKEVSSIIKALADSDWTVRQAAHFSLENITGMIFDFDPLEDKGLRDKSLEKFVSSWKNDELRKTSAGSMDKQVKLRAIRALGACLLMIGVSPTTPGIECPKPLTPFLSLSHDSTRNNTKTSS